jgi:hypothetical protein
VEGSTDFRENSQAVQSHLAIMQSVIQRMAANSTSAKTWCITLVSAILVIVADKQRPQYVWLSLVPAILFFGLDAYYLALERGFRSSYNAFIKKLHSNALEVDDLFVVEPKGNLAAHFKIALRSLSIWPFYGMMLLVIVITSILVR